MKLTSGSTLQVMLVLENVTEYLKKNLWKLTCTPRGGWGIESAQIDPRHFGMVPVSGGVEQ